MLFESWQIRITDMQSALGLGILIYRPVKEGHEVLHFPYGVPTITRILRGGMIGPECYAMIVSEEILSVLQTAIADHGVRSTEESTIRGRYEAQGEHITDLQHILGWFMNGQKMPKPVFVPQGSMVTGMGIMRGPLKKAEKRDL